MTMKRFIVQALVVGLAVLAGLIVTRPHLLLKVPNVGFVLFSLVGGSVPGYMDSTPFQRHDEWVRKGDVFAAVPGKSGTTWTMYTLHLIRARGQPAPFDDLYREVRWAEFVYYPGQSVEERIEIMRNTSQRYAFSIFKTHLSPLNMPIIPEAKYVVLVRNFYDVVASLRDFFRNTGPEFAKVWGGFPPGAGEDTLMTDAAWEHFVTKDSGNGKPFADLVLDTVRGWWPHRKLPNVLFVHYSDRIKNDQEQVSKIAKFIGVDLTREEVENIARSCSFAEMKKIQRKFELPHIFDEFVERKLLAPDVTLLNRRVKNPMLKTGPTRDGNKELTPTMRATLEEMVVRQFGPKVAHWVEHGGEMPMDVDLPA